MKFEELSEKHQDFLMHSLSNFIKSKIKRGNTEAFIEAFIAPTYEEYRAFFDEFDEEYEIFNDCPESEACKGFSVKFKAILEVHE